MRIQRPFAAGAALAGAVGLALPLVLLADASPDPLDVSTNVGRSDPASIALALGLVSILVGIAVIAKRRQGSGRTNRAAAILMLGGVFGLITVLAGLLSDWSGQHRINGPLVITGGAIMLVSLVWSVRLARGHDHHPVDPPE